MEEEIFYLILAIVWLFFCIFRSNFIRQLTTSLSIPRFLSYLQDSLHQKYLLFSNSLDSYSLVYDLPFKIQEARIHIGQQHLVSTVGSLLSSPSSFLFLRMFIFILFYCRNKKRIRTNRKIASKRTVTKNEKEEIERKEF